MEDNPQSQAPNDLQSKSLKHIIPTADRSKYWLHNPVPIPKGAEPDYVAEIDAVVRLLDGKLLRFTGKLNKFLTLIGVSK